MVEVYAGDGVDVAVVGGWGTVYAGVVAYMVAVPIGGVVVWVRSDGVF